MQNPYGGGPPPGYGPPHPQGQMQQHPQQHPHSQPQQQVHPGYGQAPQGYGQPPHMPPANPQWGPPGQAMQQQRLVGGVPLDTSEKVLYFYRCSRIATVIFGIVFGILLIPAFGIGLLLLWGTINDRKDGTYCQVVTNKRILAINGHGKPLWEMKWEDVRGLNKVVGRRYEFGVRNAQGAKFMFSDNVHIVEMVLTKFAGDALAREQAPEVQYDRFVN